MVKSQLNETSATKDLLGKQCDAGKGTFKIYSNKCKLQFNKRKTLFGQIENNTDEKHPNWQPNDNQRIPTMVVILNGFFFQGGPLLSLSSS